MKEFVNVRVSCDGTEVFFGSLNGLFEEGSHVEFESELSGEHPVVLSVVYEMPREIGNEAQGTYADFNIHLQVKKT